MRRVAICTFVLLVGCTQAATFVPVQTTATTALPSRTPAQAVKPTEDELPPPSRFDPDNSVTPGFAPNSLAFFDRRNGVIGGRITCPRRCEGRGQGVIAITTNHGRTWKVVTRAAHPITHLTIVPGTETVWATASDCHYFLTDCGRLLLRSDDGGRTWTRTFTDLINPTFASEQVGFAPTGEVFDGHRRARIARTFDGGATWTRVRGPCRGWQNMTVALSFPTVSHGWALCAMDGAGAGFFQFKAVYETSDGGSSWTPVYASDLDGGLGCCIAANGGAVGLRMFEDGSGYTWTGGVDGTFLYRTVDGGNGWEPVWTGDIGREIVDQWWTDGSNAFSIRWRSWRGWTLVYSRDAGRSWSTIGRWDRP